MTRTAAPASILFSRDAADYDDLRRRLIPCFDDFYGSALKVIQEWRPPRAFDVLDIGAGTGLFSAMVLAQHHAGRLCLLDASAAMLEQARTRFAGNDHVEYRVADMAHADLGGPWDAVISSLAIHHLSDDEKRRLYGRIRAALKPGGVFLNAEQVAGPNPFTDALYERIWLEQVRKLGAPEPDIEKALERMAFDLCASVNAQIKWLEEAGFSDVDCSYKSWRFAVLNGRA
jgi:SAM-dependent methyltransferase